MPRTRPGSSHARKRSRNRRPSDEESVRKALDDLIARSLAYRQGSELKSLFDLTMKFPLIAPYNAMLLPIQKHEIGTIVKMRYGE